MSRYKIKVCTDFPSKVDEALLRKICAPPRKARYVFLSQFPRYGFSGAKLLLTYFSAKPVGLPYLIKIAPYSKAREEHRAIRKMHNWVRDCRLEDDRLFRKGDMGALLYPHFGTDRHEEVNSPLTLKQVLFCSENEYPVGRLTSCLETVFEKLSQAHGAYQWVERDVHELYDRYLRAERATPCIASILGADSTVARFQLFGAEIDNPLLFEQALPARILVPEGPTHGDLHPDNVVIDRYSEVHIIDWAWANPSGDILIDFVLMENSVRFWHFPRCCNFEEQLWVDTLLLEEEGFKEIESCDLICEESTNHYRRLAQIVGAIRTQARRILGTDFDMRRYLFSQFISLYGLISFENYNAILSSRYLGMIAKRLEAGT